MSKCPQQTVESKQPGDQNHFLKDVLIHEVSEALVGVSDGVGGLKATKGATCREDREWGEQENNIHSSTASWGENIRNLSSLLW